MTEEVISLEPLGLKHLETAHEHASDIENTGSYRVMEKLGMKRVGVRDGRKNRAATDISKEYRYEKAGSGRRCGI